MSEVVVDASALGSVFLTDEDQSLGRLALATWSAASVRAPAHWPIEVMSILVKAERLGRLSPQDCDTAWVNAMIVIQSCRVETVTANPAIFTLAREQGISPHDAAYIELAARLSLPLLTGDKAMAHAAKSLSIDLIFDPL